VKKIKEMVVHNMVLTRFGFDFDVKGRKVGTTILMVLLVVGWLV
jgi:hypothetical protein